MTASPSTPRPAPERREEAPDLLPCPFCGAKALEYVRADLCSIPNAGTIAEHHAGLVKAADILENSLVVTTISNEDAPFWALAEDAMEEALEARKPPLEVLYAVLLALAGYVPTRGTEQALAPSPGTREPDETEGWAASRVAEVMAEGDGWWKACSGCQGSVDGWVNPKDYPFSAMFRCQPGAGCGECGGLGVIWEQAPTEADLAIWERQAREPRPAPAPGTREAGLERATALIFETMCQLAQDYDIPRETVWNDPDAMDAARETARAALRALASPAKEGEHD